MGGTRIDGYGAPKSHHDTQGVDGNDSDLARSFGVSVITNITGVYTMPAADMAHTIDA